MSALKIHKYFICLLVVPLLYNIYNMCHSDRTLVIVIWIIMHIVTFYVKSVDENILHT